MNSVTTNFDEMTYEDFMNDDTFNQEPYGDVGDGGEFAESLIENMTKNPESIEIPVYYLDQIAENEDYMEFNDYLEGISDNFELVEKVIEYIKFNYPEFFEDVQVAGREKIVKQEVGENLSRNFSSSKSKGKGFPTGKPTQRILN
ncbi:MAG TPA: hypothetical protein PLP73_01620, partial [Candidatus Absconditabacterales bacterium]|nr:hypothetical protein [Candidatus Absconditabacterales bacterium]